MRLKYFEVSDAVGIVTQHIEMQVFIPVSEDDEELVGGSLDSSQVLALWDVLGTQPHASFGGYQFPFDEITGRAVLKPGQSNGSRPHHALHIQHPLLCARLSCFPSYPCEPWAPPTVHLGQRGKWELCRRGWTAQGRAGKLCQGDSGRIRRALDRVVCGLQTRVQLKWRSICGRPRRSQRGGCWTETCGSGWCGGWWRGTSISASPWARWWYHTELHPGQRRHKPSAMTPEDNKTRYMLCI